MPMDHNEKVRVHCLLYLQIVYFNNDVVFATLSLGPFSLFVFLSLIILVILHIQLFIIISYYDTDGILCDLDR